MKKRREGECVCQVLDVWNLSEPSVRVTPLAARGGGCTPGDNDAINLSPSCCRTQSRDFTSTQQKEKKSSKGDSSNRDRSKKTEERTGLLVDVLSEGDEGPGASGRVEALIILVPASLSHSPGLTQLIKGKVTPPASPTLPAILPHPVSPFLPHRLCFIHPASLTFSHHVSLALPPSLSHTLSPTP
ncbi:hypothetical protein Pcinc_009852 [Petrolisthes cinctipes]|uniref:Uncharacterized protein n=1 Tax=Petrolisthes cinctipes TaxID=88211 RepID=A0AAE1KVY0_PETCI|nr:hypothetical protein Pcinc_009852 [Petrolisthes cinctipes]